MVRWAVTKGSRAGPVFGKVALEGSLRYGCHFFSWKILNLAYSGWFLRIAYASLNSTQIMLTCINIFTFTFFLLLRLSLAVRVCVRACIFAV